MKRLTVITVVLAVAVLAAGGVALVTARVRVTQPIAFNHRFHLEDVGLDCTDCHLYAKSGPRATIPNLAVCSDCHEEAQGESEQEARLVEYVQQGTLIPWRKVYRVPGHVYFSHRRHTAIGGIECEVCHGQMREREQPVTRPAVQVTMDRCMDCHVEQGVSNDCVLCHR